jgi:pantoate--beta-alanine ligase
MDTIASLQEMQARAAQWRAASCKIAFVPTMGYFHRGHVSLMEYGRKLGDKLVVSLFVNPTQFAPTEDLDRYPRDLERDAKMAEKAGVDVLFTPTAEQMYPPGYQTYVTVDGLSQGLCGAFRPGHFRGVATVVCKLFNLVMPHTAIFGEKDYQQLMVIKRVVADLNLPVEVVGRPIVREEDGLAMSSRNTYLSPEQRRSALSLQRGLTAARRLVSACKNSREEILAVLRQIISQEPDTRIDYLALVDPETLEEVEAVQGAARLAMAVWVGNTRLIDNSLLVESKPCCV